MQELVLFGVPAAVLIIVLVDLAKGYGLDSRWAPLAAIGLGILFAALGQLATQYPGFALWYEIVIVGLVTGLTAAGLYSGQKAVRQASGPLISAKKLPFRARKLPR